VLGDPSLQSENRRLDYKHMGAAAALNQRRYCDAAFPKMHIDTDILCNLNAFSAYSCGYFESTRLSQPPFPALIVSAVNPQ
jgi:hypothetical protein